MDFDIGNIIYIVATLLAVIAGLASNRKKKPGGTGATPAGQENGGQQEPGFMENLERFLSGGQEQPVVMDLDSHEPDILPESPDVAVEEVKTEAPGGILADYERLMSRRTEEELDELLEEGLQTSDQLEVVDLDKEGADFFDVIEEFDAARAIVYSAIINRLDY
jgi:hypothetical protein